jgi:sporulation protein YlmC with PRC-barrel domain
MSLIVARKEGTKLAIVSDTKLTYENHEIKGLKTVPSEGVIKIVIINPNLCISFANVVSHAEKALKEIQSECNFDQAIQILTSHFHACHGKTEFIVCSGKPEPKIYEIKARNVGEVQSSWIGDINAFNLFQECMQGIKKPKQLLQQYAQPNSNAAFVMSMDMTAETNMQVNLFSKMSSAMDEVIEEGNIDSVGGL